MFIELLLISVVVQLFLFIPAFLLKTDKLTDFSYSLGFIVVASWTFLQGDRNIYHLWLYILIVLWSLRLGVYLVYRIANIGTDKRFDNIRISFLKFIKFWIFQGLVIPIILFPSVYFFNSYPKFEFGMVIGTIIWILGMLIESVADIQKFKFKKVKTNKNKWIETGVWKYSRHPNYLGEILCWLGIYIFTFGSLEGYEIVIASLSPLTISVLLIFISGIPILEKKADEKWGGIGEYKKYKSRTPVLIPFLSQSIWFKR